MPEDIPAARETYTHGYATAARRQVGRTAASHAGFFTPHLKPGMKVLDCGCGPGSITVGLADIVSPGETVGIDVGSSVIETANGLVGERKNVRFEEASIYELPFEDSSFDAIFINKVLEHLGDPQAALVEAVRVLRPGGVVGARSTDQGARIIVPMSNAVDRMFDNLQARWQTNGGNPFFGRAQQPTMRAAGLISLSTTYRVEAITGDRDEAGISQVLGGDYSEWLARGFLTDEQVADEDGMKDFIADLIAFSEHPDSVFFTSVDFETVGWKPE